MSHVAAPGISALFLRHLALSVGRLGGDARAFLRELGVDESTDIDSFVDGARVGHALEKLARAQREGALGLALARASPLGSLGLVDYCAIMGPTMRDALYRTSRLYGLLSQRVTLSIEESRGLVRVLQRVRRGARAPVLIEFAFALFVRRMREMVGPPPLRSVRFAHAAHDAAPYEEYFATRVRFGAPVDELVLEATYLDATVGTADPVTATMLEDYARRLQTKQPPTDPFLDGAREAVARRLRSGDDGVSGLAGELGMSRRTLQRRLTEHGMSHRSLLEEVRRESAIQLLGRARVSAVEIAHELGFTRTAAFYRAFARWTGTTPGAFRKRRLS